LSDRRLSLLRRPHQRTSGQGRASPRRTDRSGRPSSVAAASSTVCFSREAHAHLALHPPRRSPSRARVLRQQSAPDLYQSNRGALGGNCLDSSHLRTSERRPRLEKRSPARSSCLPGFGDGFAGASLGCRQSLPVLASATASRELRSAVDRAYQFNLDDPGSEEAKALASVNAQLPDACKFTSQGAFTAKQKTLSRAIDAARFAKVFNEAPLAGRKAFAGQEHETF